MRTSLARSILLLCTVTLIVGACGIVEAPYTTSRVDTPLSITLTFDRPVAVIRPTVERAALPSQASVSPSEARFRGVDRRIRVAVGDLVHPAAIVRPTEQGDLFFTVSGSVSARKDGGLAPTAMLPFHFRDAASYRSTPADFHEVFDAPIDGTSRSVAVPLFAHCVPGADCTLDFWFEVFAPRPADGSPVIVSYRVDARVTAYGGRPLTAKTSLAIESTGEKQPPDVR